MSVGACSKTFHSLFEVLLQPSCLVDASSINEVWSYLSEAVDIIDKRAKVCAQQLLYCSKCLLNSDLGPVSYMLFDTMLKSLVLP